MARLRLPQGASRAILRTRQALLETVRRLRRMAIFAVTLIFVAAAMFDALKAGDVLLLSARWLMAHAGYEEGEVEVTIGPQKVKVKKWAQVREAAPLPCRQQIEADHPEAMLPAAKLEIIYGQLKRRDKHGEEIPFDALPVVSVSQCAQSARANARGRGALVPPRPR